MKKAFVFLVFSGLSLGLLSGCASEGGSSVPGVTDSTIVIGSWGPQTGPAALWGAVPRGTETYFNMVNAQGGIHGRQIVFLHKDDGYEPSRTVAAVKELVERDQVFAVVGGVGTATGMAVKSYLIQNGVPWVSPASGNVNFSQPPEKTIFSVYPLYADEAAVLVDYAVAELGATKIAMFYQNDDYGKSGLLGAQIAAGKHGLELVEAVSVEPLDQDVSSQALRLKEAEADVVIAWVLPRHGAQILGATANLGYRPQWMTGSTLSDTNLMHTITQGLWEGVIFTTFGQLPTSDTEIMDRYRAAKAEFARPEEADGFFFYAGFMFAEPLVEGLRRAGRELTRDNLIAALESLDGFQGVGAPITFGTDNRLGIRSMYLARCTSTQDADVLSDWMAPRLGVEEILAAME